MEYTYRDHNGRLKKIAYANGDYARLGYDRYGNMISEKWFDKNGLPTYEYVYAYDNEGNIVKTIDKENFKEYNYIYDEGKLIRAVEYGVTIENDVVTSKTKVVSIVYVYNEEGELVKRKAAYPDGAVTGNTPSTYTVNGKEINGSEFFITPSIEEEVIPFVSVVTTTDTDELGRKTSDSVGKTANGIVRSFTYVEGLDPTELGGYNEHVLSQNKVDLTQDKYKPTTQLVKNITVKDDESTLHTFSYEYDEEERIKKLVETYTVNGEIITDTTLYSYDDLGQLLTETKNGTVINAMTYDGYGNILTKNGNTYGYINAAWDDLLTHYNGQQITYDEQGNPTTYRGKSLVWEKGRQLRSYDGITYTYNANGIRTSKKIGNVKHTYIIEGTKVLKETWGENTLIPLYDNEDNVCGISYNGETYYFVKNLQGDVVAIADAGNTIVARYSYDAWGVCTVTATSGYAEVANANPYRYRGYYYDVETGLYYVSSRYYDPEIGRFINADNPGIAFLVDSPNFNLYAYCENNVVNDCDYSGFASYRTRSKTLNKLIEALEKAIPNIYTEDFWCKEKRLLRVGTTNLSLTISCGVAAQTNKNALFGGLFKKGTLEASAFFGVSNYVCFSFSAGITWSKAYIKVGLLLAMSRGPVGFYGGAYVELSVPTWLLAVATVAVGVACIYNPAVGAYIAKFIGSIQSSARVAAATLVPIFPYIVRAAT